MSTSKLKDWFGPSVVTDTGEPGGNPLVVFHGSESEVIRTFKPGVDGAAWFSEGRWLAEEFGRNIFPVYLSISNPIQTGTPEARAIAAAALAKNPKASLREIFEPLGYDGVISDEYGGRRTGDKTWLAFRPEQIKSAVDNNGDYDKSNQDIRFSVPEAAPDVPTGQTAFNDWFGSSVITDTGAAGGNPIPVYHGTAADFSVFDRRLLGSTSETSDSMLGFWFAENPVRASSAAIDAAIMRNDSEEIDGANVMPVFLSMQNPAEAVAPMGDPEESARIIRRAKRQGFDGVIFHNGEGGKNYLVFKPGQIKSAIGNNWQLSAREKDLRFSVPEHPPVQPTAGAAFKDWFGPSVVTDTGEPGGNPLVAFHGTRDDIVEVDTLKSNRLPGFWVTPDAGLASTYAAEGVVNASSYREGANVMPLYVKIERPYRFDPHKKPMQLAWQEYLEGDYDGFIETGADAKAITTMAVRSANQIKSATGNNGDFDSEVQDIRFSVPDEEDGQREVPSP